ncbi:hypothetical protein ATCVMN08101_1029R [Acanthocystis turfacea Chlorella virus MN0810.1]|nr:hypothetical protein ATCVMN08101_1029R [Acanthocystis turfacea Chlorella virus MN0810.1]
MASSRALEYVSRFSAGRDKHDAWREIVDYRDECKVAYNKALNGYMRFADEKTRWEFLDDMKERIKALAEARDCVWKPNAPTKVPKGEYISPRQPVDNVVDCDDEIFVFDN